MGGNHSAVGLLNDVAHVIGELSAAEAAAGPAPVLEVIEWLRRDINRFSRTEDQGERLECMLRVAARAVILGAACAAGAAGEIPHPNPLPVGEGTRDGADVEAA